MGFTEDTFILFYMLLNDVKFRGFLVQMFSYFEQYFRDLLTYTFLCLSELLLLHFLFNG